MDGRNADFVGATGTHQAGVTITQIFRLPIQTNKPLNLKANQECSRALKSSRYVTLAACNLIGSITNLNILEDHFK